MIARPIRHTLDQDKFVTKNDSIIRTRPIVEPERTAQKVNGVLQALYLFEEKITEKVTIRK